MSSESETTVITWPRFLFDNIAETSEQIHDLSSKKIVPRANKTDSEKALLDDNDNVVLLDKEEPLQAVNHEESSNVPLLKSGNTMLDIIEASLALPDEGNYNSNLETASQEADLIEAMKREVFLAGDTGDSSVIVSRPKEVAPAAAAQVMFSSETASDIGSVEKESLNPDEEKYLEILDQTESANIVFIESPEKIHIRKRRYQTIWTRFEEAIRTESFKANYITKVPSKGDMMLVQEDGVWYRGAFKGEQDQVLKVKLVDIGKTVHIGLGSLREISNNLKVQDCYTEVVKLDLEIPGGDVEWPATTIDALRRKLRPKDEVLVRNLDSGKDKKVELLKVCSNLDNPFEPEKVSHVSVTKFLLDKGLALKSGTRQRMSQNLPADKTFKNRY